MGVVRRFPAPTVPNPFIHHIKWTIPLFLETVIGAIFLLPLRALLMLAVVPAITAVGYAASLGYNGKPDEHINLWQRKLIKITFPFLSRLGLLSLGYNWVHVKGRKASYEEAPVLVVAPHTIWADGPALVAYTMGRVVTRVANKYLLMQREVLMCLESIFIDRSAPGPRKVMKAHMEAPGCYLQLTGCPEGTTHRGDGLLSFKPGMFLAGLPAQPVFFDFGPKDPGVALWAYSGIGTLSTILLSMCQFHNTLTVAYLPVYRPSVEEKADPVLFANNIRLYMANLIERPALNYSYEDASYTDQAMQLGLPDFAGAIQHTPFREAFGFNSQIVKEQMKRFAAMNVSRSGFVTEQEFCDYFNWPVDGDCKRMFAYYTTNPEHRDRITFAEFLAGLGDLAYPLTNDAGEEAVEELAFTMLAGPDGIISTGSLRKAIPTLDQSSDLHVQGVVDRLTRQQPSSYGRGAFMATLQHDPELRVLLQWLLHGCSSYPAN